MFDSKITASDFIASIRREIDAAPDIEEATYLRFIDEAEQLIYSEIIRETAQKRVQSEGGYLALSSVPAEDGADAVRFEDIHDVYAGDVHLIRTAPVSGRTFPDAYWKDGAGLKHNAKEQSLDIYYFVRPALKSREGGRTDVLRLPVEWLTLISSKMRGEALKLVNEDELAAKWLADYNVLLEHFGQYMSARQPELYLGSED